MALGPSRSVGLSGVHAIADDETEICDRKSKTFSEGEDDDLELQEIVGVEKSDLVATAWSTTTRRHFIIGYEIIC